MENYVPIVSLPQQLTQVIATLHYWTLTTWCHHVLGFDGIKKYIT